MRDHKTLLALLLLTPVVASAAEERPLPKDLPPLGQDRPLPAPQVVASRLPEGLTVWLVPRPGLPKITAELAVRGGEAADGKGYEGLGEMLADLLKAGTKRRSARQIAEELQALGGEISGASSQDAIYLSVSALSSGADKAIEVLADVARNPSFPQKEVALEKENATQGLLARESTPEFLGARVFAREVYGQHPYRTVGPTKESIAAVTPEILAREHARRFRPDRALLVVAGDFAVDAMGRTVAAAFGGWRGVGEAPAPTPASPGAAGRRLLLVHRPGSVQSLILTGRPVATVTEPDYYPLLVANTVCCGSFSGRMTRNIREDKGYSYSPGGRLAAQEKGGLLQLRADVRSEVTAASLLEIFYEMDRMATTAPTAEELQRAKRYQSGLYLLKNQIQGAVAQSLATNWVNGLGPEALGQFVGRVGAVGTEDVRRVSQRYYPSLTQTVVIVGDRDKVKPALAPFGAVQETNP